MWRVHYLLYCEYNLTHRRKWDACVAAVQCYQYTQLSLQFYWTLYLISRLDLETQTQLCTAQHSSETPRGEEGRVGWMRKEGRERLKAGGRKYQRRGREKFWSCWLSGWYNQGNEERRRLNSEKRKVGMRKRKKRNFAREGNWDGKEGRRNKS